MARWLRMSLLAGIGIFALAGCKQGESAQWLLNGFFDPSQAGQFLNPKRTEIRGSLSILEEPLEIQDAVDPGPDDVVVRYEDHRIIPGDVLTVSVFELLVPGQTYAQQISVGSSGFASLPVMGRVRMAEKTITELELYLKELLRDAEILPEPEVQIALLDTRADRFSIIGSVPRPGTYVIQQKDYRLLSALADAGGISPVIERVYVFRRGAPAAEAPSTTQATKPAMPMGATMSFGPAFTMSDVASGPSTTRANETTRPAVTRPAVAPSPIDELEILEGGPTAEKQEVRWDPTEGWVIEPIGDQAARDAAATTSKTPVPTADRAAFEPRPEDLEPGGEEDLSQPVRIIEIPTKELMTGDPRYNVVIRPYDLINVATGQVGEYYMMGNVTRPGAYELTGRKLTVKEAVAAAGGFGPLAWPSRADLIRRVTRDEEQIIQLDLDAIFAGNAPDFYLKPNDIVNVGTSPAAIFLAVLRNSFRFSYGFGFVYDRNFADADAFLAKEQLKTRRTQEALQRGLPPP